MWKCTTSIDYKHWIIIQRKKFCYFIYCSNSSGKQNKDKLYKSKHNSTHSYWKAATYGYSTFFVCQHNHLCKIKIDVNILFKISCATQQFFHPVLGNLWGQAPSVYRSPFWICGSEPRSTFIESDSVLTRAYIFSFSISGYLV